MKETREKIGKERCYVCENHSRDGCRSPNRYTSKGFPCLIVIEFIERISNIYKEAGYVQVPDVLPVLGEQGRESIADKPFTDDEVNEIESMATIGLTNDDPYAGIEYENRLNHLCQWVKRRRVAQAEADLIKKTLKEAR